MAPVSGQSVPGGVVHKLPADLRGALVTNAAAAQRRVATTPYRSRTRRSGSLRAIRTKRYARPNCLIEA
jgi:hypothetical protein